MSIRAEQNLTRAMRNRCNDFIAKLPLTEEQKEELAKRIDNYVDARVKVKEKEFEIELRQLINSMSRLTK